jgi:hypothetical protein
MQNAFDISHCACCLVHSMGTLSSELAAHADRLSPRPRIYADANVPAGLVAFMRTRLRWDVLFVLEEDTLRRAPDATHFRLAQQLRRTLVTLDRDYLDDRRFPPAEGSGVLVIHAPDERLLSALLDRINRAIFQESDECGDARIVPLPLVGRKMHVHTDWTGIED